MKKIFLFCLLLTIFISSSFSQTLQPVQKPTGQPGKPSLPTPNIPNIKPADLLISNIIFAGATLMTDVKAEYVKLNITVQNSGQTKAPSTRIVAFFQNGDGTGGWKQFDNILDVPAINAGQSYTGVFTFKVLLSSIGTLKKLNVYAEADADRAVNEISETNNASNHILIAL
ncbi:MAG: CARDB domain-containing protein [Chitinophagaceae bacterium]